MLARHDGAIVLVAGALPGELVEASVERVQKATTWASTTRVLEPSTFRVETNGDVTCGGDVYAHATYEHQLTLKSQVIADAFTRVARLRLDGTVAVRPSPVDGYRMRARLHVRNGRVGFFREGTHQLCDATPTRQLLPATVEVVRRLEDVIRELPKAGVSEIEIAENRQASQRAVHLELAADGDPSRLAAATTIVNVTGVSCSVGTRGRTYDLSGDPHVTDVLDVAIGAEHRAPVGLTRHARAFFQGNRYLLEPLVEHVLSLVPDGPVVDLYSGVGLFAVPLAARRSGAIVAVESDRIAAVDLQQNAQPWSDTLTVHAVPAEAVHTWKGSVRAGATVIVDPPRTGLSRQALDAVMAVAPPRIVYVSCDVATLARDVRIFVDRGYRVAAAEAFDLFPNTAHVETVMMLDRQA